MDATPLEDVDSASAAADDSSGVTTISGEAWRLGDTAFFVTFVEDLGENFLELGVLDLGLVDGRS